MNALIVAVIGALAGLHAATWGGYKDSPFEGFRPASFLRTLCLGVGWGFLVGLSGVVGSSTGFLIAVGACYAGERLLTEWWKAILRDDNQSAYSIPMRLAVRGRPVDARLPRYAVGAVIAVVLVVACVIVSALNHGPGDLPWWAGALVLGTGGWLTAIGGAWKDAPVEGFQLWKFFRSPVVATAWGVLLVPFSPSLALLIVAAGGLSVATIETYKTFLVGGPPGKFAGKQERFEVGRVRGRCRRVHGGLYGVLAAAFAADLLNPPIGPTRELAGDAACLVTFAWAICCAALVLAAPNSATVETSGGSGSFTGPSGRLSDADVRGANS